MCLSLGLVPMHIDVTMKVSIFCQDHTAKTIRRSKNLLSPQSEFL